MKILMIIRKMDITLFIKSKFIFVTRFSEIIDHKYLTIKKLGWGHFSTVWLALKL
jgi:hypothetical protein